MKDTSCMTAEMLIENEPSIHDIFRSGAIKTGFKDLDDMTEGFFPGELICIAGRNSMGATGLALSILNRVCIKEGKRCLYFALAEDGRSIMSRLVANVSCNQDIFRPEHEDELKDTLRKIERSLLSINETAFFIVRIFCSECGLVYNDKEARGDGFSNLIDYWNHIGIYMPQDG